MNLKEDILISAKYAAYTFLAVAVFLMAIIFLFYDESPINIFKFFKQIFVSPTKIDFKELIEIIYFLIGFYILVTIQFSLVRPLLQDSIEKSDEKDSSP